MTDRERRRRGQQSVLAQMIKFRSVSGRKQRRMGAMGQRRIDWRQLNPHACGLTRRVIRGQLMLEHKAEVTKKQKEVLDAEA